MLGWWGGENDGEEVCTCMCVSVRALAELLVLCACVSVCVGWGGVRGGHLWVLRIETPTNLTPSPLTTPSIAEPPPPHFFTWAGHLPLLMKIHGFISISGVISETAKHKTGLFPQRPGEPDRMTRLSALAEQGSCRA